MNVYLFIASCLSVVLAFAHSLLGEIKIFKFLKDEGLPTMQGIPFMWNINGPAKRTLRFVWHISSILGLGIAAILAYFSNQASIGKNEIFVVKMIAASMILSGLLTLVMSKASHLGWILF